MSEDLEAYQEVLDRVYDAHNKRNKPDAPLTPEEAAEHFREHSFA